MSLCGANQERDKKQNVAKTDFKFLHVLLVVEEFSNKMGRRRIFLNESKSYMIHEVKNIGAEVKI